ncbi:MAG: alcohol dehydrogenase catalytic domain-containing protein [Acidobacteria bacterium]|nr:alcohol dehydrogenase catalytic domain-containing protein [Acidobacteriota bacterium]
MKAISFAAPIPTYLATQVAGRLSERWLVGPHACTRYADVATPDLPGQDWVRIRTVLRRHLRQRPRHRRPRASPSTSPFSSFPFVIGHENVGVIEACGTSVRGFGGDRVTVNPLLCCEPRGSHHPVRPARAGTILAAILYRRSDCARHVHRHHAGARRQLGRALRGASVPARQCGRQGERHRRRH